MRHSDVEYPGPSFSCSSCLCSCSLCWNSDSGSDDQQGGPISSSDIDAVEEAETSSFSYDLDHAVGLVRGGYGTIYKVQRTHRGTGAIEDVAVKAVPIDAQSKKPQPDPREIRALLFIKDHPHENIIRYFEKFDSSNEHKFGGVPHTCFVFELFRRDLHDEIKQITPEKLWPEQRIASIAAQILKGLVFLHENHFVHRDIKSDNIMVDDTYNIKITDFGLTAEMPNGKTIMDMEGWSGSLHYMSPEEWNCKLGYCSDVWATGVIIFELCNAGKRPWEAYLVPPNLSTQAKQKLKEKDLSNKICYTQPNWNSEYLLKYSENARDFLKSLLRKDSASRPAASAALQSNWLKSFI